MIKGVVFGNGWYIKSKKQVKLLVRSMPFVKRHTENREIVVLDDKKNQMIRENHLIYRNNNPQH